jgi:hypothetical protein
LVGDLTKRLAKFLSAPERNLGILLAKNPNLLFAGQEISATSSPSRVAQSKRDLQKKNARPEKDRAFSKAINR